MERFIPRGYDPCKRCNPSLHSNMERFILYSQKKQTFLCLILYIPIWRDSYQNQGYYHIRSCRALHSNIERFILFWSYFWLLGTFLFTFQYREIHTRQASRGSVEALTLHSNIERFIQRFYHHFMHKYIWDDVACIIIMRLTFNFFAKN